MDRKLAVICGVTGQDGSYLADLLLKEGYIVVGVHRRSSTTNTWRIEHNLKDPDFILESGDVTDYGSIHRIVYKYNPCEFYNLAAQSHVRVSWEEPVHTGQVVAIGTLVCLESIRNNKSKAKFYQASSSEMFGKVVETPQRETTPFYPRSPYGVAKVYAYWMTRNYRESYNMFTCNGILFNHESPRRGREFITRKITDGVAQIITGKIDHITLGNLDSERDWGAAPDYMEAAWMMLQHDEPDDYVVATGEKHSIRELLEIAFRYVGLDWHKHVKQDERFMRPAEVDLLLGDSTKIRTKLNWQPTYTFRSMIEEMLAADLQRHGA